MFVCGLERGLVPIVHAETPAELDEERRLLHVALSRAEDTLHLSWARKRAIGMRTYTRDPSPWLDEVERALGGRAGAEPAADGVRRAAASRACATRSRRHGGAGPRPAGSTPCPIPTSSRHSWSGGATWPARPECPPT